MGGGEKQDTYLMIVLLRNWDDEFCSCWIFFFMFFVWLIFKWKEQKVALSELRNCECLDIVGYFVNNEWEVHIITE